MTGTGIPSLRRVWVITVGETLPLNNRRVRMYRSGVLAHMLAERGVDVVWWTSSVDHFTKEYHVEGNEEVALGERLTLKFLHGRLYKRNVSLARFINHLEIARAFSAAAPEMPAPDLILCSFPTIELSAAATAHGRSAGVPVLLDIRDLWPDEMIAKLPRVLRFLGPVLFRSMLLQAKRALREATGVVAVGEAYLRWGLAHAGRSAGPNDAVFTHGYPRPEPTTPEEAAAVGTTLLKTGVDPSKRIFWFVGGFIGSIDLGTVIEAARRLTDRPDVQFVLSGSGEREAEWRALAKGLDNVVFTGWVDRPAIAWLSRVAHVGLAAYKPGALMSLTNKIFEYLSAGLPVLISLPGEAAEIVVGEDCGRFYEPGNPASLETAVRAVLDDPETRDRQSRNARNLFETRYAADIVYDRMIAFMEKVATDHTRREGGDSGA